MNKPLMEQVVETSTWIRALRAEVGRVIVGQEQLVERLLVGLLANGHVLLEGVPGLAKTLSVRTLAAAVQASFRRIQFTPDLLPADIVGNLIYSPQDGKYHATQGPVFANFVLADEINRAPGQGAVRAARSHAGTAGHARWRNAQIAVAVSCACHRKSD